MSELNYTQIDIDNDINLQYWCQAMGCDKQDLIETVLHVGNQPKIVELYLSLNRKINYQKVKL